MKKKLLSILLAFTLVFSLSVTAFAAVSSHDRDNLSSAQQAAIAAATEAYNNATTDAGRAAAHAAAEAVRNSAGYQSNSDGTYSGSYSGGSVDTTTTHSSASNKHEYNDEASNTVSNGTYDSTGHTAADQQNMAGLTDEDTLTIAYLEELWNRSDVSGNSDAQDAAHAVAEALRNAYGYSGGDDGGFYYADDDSHSRSVSYDDDSGSISVGQSTYYTITATAGTGGSISPSGAIAVKKGVSQTYAITANSGYNISSVKVDGSSVGAVSTYTFSNVRSAHSISVTFESNASLNAGDVTLGDGGDGTLTSGNATKSGYGITANVSVASSYVSNTTVTATYNFTSAQTVSLEKVGGTWQFPVNSSSVTGARKIYIPVETKDGTYTITFTVKALDPQATALTGSNVYLTDTKTVTLTIDGSMYEDDFTADS